MKCNPKFQTYVCKEVPVSECSLTYSGKIHPLPLYIKKLCSRTSGFMSGDRFPRIEAVWRNFRIDPGHLAATSRLCGLTPGKTVPVFYPLTFLFPLHMSLITHREFPLSFLKMLHLRDHIVQHRAIGVGELMGISSRIAGQRVVPRGIEFDVCTTITSDGATVWEGISTNFFPGRFGGETDPSPLSRFEPMPGRCSTIQWTMPGRGGFRFALLAGDYNGIHYLAPYARLMGFKRDFLHGQRSIAECVRRIPSYEQESVVLSLVLKGPVYYRSEVFLKYAPMKDGFRFDLHARDDRRPCILGSLIFPGDAANEMERPE